MVGQGWCKYQNHSGMVSVPLFPGGKLIAQLLRRCNNPVLRFLAEGDLLISVQDQGNRRLRDARQLGHIIGCGFLHKNPSDLCNNIF